MAYSLPDTPTRTDTNRGYGLYPTPEPHLRPLPESVFASEVLEFVSTDHRLGPRSEENLVSDEIERGS